MEEIKLISGGIHSDDRGSLYFNNDVILNQVKRFYQITPINTDVIRAWQGHKKETKWFYATQGNFLINCVKIDDFDAPTKELSIHSFEITNEKTEVLIVPGGYATGIKSLSKTASLMVFSDYSLENAKDDDFRWESDYFINCNWKI
jgi:dTDP-4-dehydrorhamnose 3,5-epimerase